MKIIWRVQPAPTGRYRSFERRGWPSAHYNDKDESPAAMILCKDDYDPSDVREGKHAELEIQVADHSYVEPHINRPMFKWRKAKQRAKTLAEAKAIVQHIIDNNPNIHPKETT